MIENMSGFVTPSGERYQLFGEGGGQLLAEELDVPLLGERAADDGAARAVRRGHPDRARRSRRPRRPGAAPRGARADRAVAGRAAGDAGAGARRGAEARRACRCRWPRRAGGALRRRRRRRGPQRAGRRDAARSRRSVGAGARARPAAGGAAVSEAMFAGVDARLSRYAYLVSLFPRPLLEQLGVRVELARAGTPRRSTAARGWSGSPTGSHRECSRR